MLTQLTEPGAAIARVAGDPHRGFIFRRFAAVGEGEFKVKVLTDDPAEPHLLVAHAGNNFMFQGELHRFQPMMEDILHGRVEQEGGWPDAGMQKDWDEHNEGRRGIFLNTAPYAVWRAAMLAGFDPHPRDGMRAVAYQWYWEGPPRFSHLVKHPCRVVEQGRELFDLMRQAVEYDPEGHYIGLCLDAGPSFVCEVDGEPKCWSCTHLSGTMGMIYTPEEFRRHGYARSLAAFQLDYMLKRDGAAYCHVIDHNIASMNMVYALGARVLPESLVWRGIYWPGEAPPAEDKDGGG